MATDNMIPGDREDAATAIRRYLAANPKSDDVEVAVFLERYGIQASPALIQQVRWEIAKEQGHTEPQ